VRKLFRIDVKPVYLVALAMIALILFALYDWHKLKTKYNEQTQITSLSSTVKLENKKKAVLSRSFDFLLDFGEDHKRIGELKLAADRYFDAKSIYPYDVKPRYELIKVYYELALLYDGYCYHAQKEIKYGLTYITAKDHPKMHEDIIKKSAHLSSFCKSVENYSFYYDK